MLEQANIEVGDVVAIVLYFVLVIGVGLVASWKSSKNSVSGYFLAGRNINWALVGASLFASNIGSGHFIGLAGSAAASGIAIAIFELGASQILLLLGWLFVPVYLAADVYTMPQYLKKRFGGKRIQIYLSVLSLILYVFTKISADLFAGAIFIKQALGWDMYAAVTLLLAVAALFTIGGGLTAVVWTDFVQTVLMLAGAAVLTVISFIKVGGYSEMMARFPLSGPNRSVYGDTKTCAEIPDDALHLFRSPTTSQYPWTGLIFGLTVSAVWYWCSDQVIVQRALAAKNLSHAKGGCILAGYFKLLPLFILVFPGMIARILYPDEIGCADAESCRNVCGNEAGCTNIAYPLLVIRLMPNGMTGLMLAVMMASLMSSLTSIFNSSSTIFTMDIWLHIRKQASDVELLIVGRSFVLILVVISILWIPVIEVSLGSELFVYIQSITSYLAPPVCAVYIAGIFSTRANEKGAFWGLALGLFVGLVRFVLEFGFPAPPCGSNKPDSRPDFIRLTVDNVHYLHFGILLFLFSLMCVAIISLLTEPIPEEKLHRLTYWTRFSAEEPIELTSANIGGQNIFTITTVPSPIPPKNTVPDYPEIPNHSIGRKIFEFICGLSKTEDDKIAVEVSSPSLDEKPFWNSFCNANAAILLVVGAFVFGFYA